MRRARRPIVWSLTVNYDSDRPAAHRLHWRTEFPKAMRLKARQAWLDHITLHLKPGRLLTFQAAERRRLARARRRLRKRR